MNGGKAWKCRAWDNLSLQLKYAEHNERWLILTATRQVQCRQCSTEICFVLIAHGKQQASNVLTDFVKLLPILRARLYGELKFTM